MTGTMSVEAGDGPTDGSTATGQNFDAVRQCDHSCSQYSAHYTRAWVDPLLQRAARCTPTPMGTGQGHPGSACY